MLVMVFIGLVSLIFDFTRSQNYKSELARICLRNDPSAGMSQATYGDYRNGFSQETLEEMAMAFSIVAGNREDIDWQLARRFDVHRSTREGWTVLAMASYVGNDELIEYFKSKGAVQAERLPARVGRANPETAEDESKILQILESRFDLFRRLDLYSRY